MLATSAVVALVAQLLMPGMPWAVAVAPGAIVSPPDAVAATALVSRLPAPRRVVVILEGESLVNDASVAERRMLVRLRNEGAISDEVLHDLEQELDLEAIRAGTGDSR